MADPVALIHGIRSRGPWFLYARSILEPHFDCKQIRYHHYSISDLFMAPLSVAFEPLILVLTSSPMRSHSGCESLG
jgi:hypothetical protein